MKHLINTFKAIGIICFMAISIFLAGATAIGAQIMEIMMEGTYYSLIATIVWGFVYLLCIKKVKGWLSFLSEFIFGNLD